MRKPNQDHENIGQEGGEEKKGKVQKKQTENVRVERKPIRSGTRMEGLEGEGGLAVLRVSSGMGR